MGWAIHLAEWGRGRTHPNPLVGAVVVHNGRVVGIGYHRQKGTSHAEVHALEEAENLTQGATLYVTLEPHAFHGTTPPCTQAIRDAGIRRVVIAALDPHPRVAGQGVRELSHAGISVQVGVGYPLARYQNRYFFTYHQKSRPYIILKLAVTLDGRLAHPKRRWITSQRSRDFVHRLRGEVDAILVGAGTVRTDNPLLTPRHVQAFRYPLRVVLGGTDLPPSTKVFQTPPPTLWIHPHPPFHPSGVEIWEEDPRDLVGILQRLAQEKDVQSVLVEGGATVATSFLDAGLVDEVIWMIAPWIGGQGPGVSGWFSFESGWVREDLSFGQEVTFRWVKREVFG